MHTPVRVYTAKALLLNEKNQVLVLWSSKWPERPDRSEQPDFPGGIVEPGETPAVGVMREVAEETGITVRENDLVLLYTETKYHAVSHDVVLKHMFAARVDEADVTLSWEHQEYRWMDLDKVLALEWRQFYRDALNFIMQHKLLDDI